MVQQPKKLLNRNGSEESDSWTGVVLYDEMVFDAIYECHKAIGQKTLGPTKAEAAKMIAFHGRVVQNFYDANVANMQ